MARVRYDVVIPTVGRPSLAALLQALAAAGAPRPERIVLVDDRADTRTPLPVGRPGPPVDELLRVLPGPARGPAAARNLGWRAGTSPWAAFLDDDVIPSPGWASQLAHDLADLPAAVAGSQGRIRVPGPAGRRPSDWERNVAALETARWATADMAYRRPALQAVGGFDERFPRAYREDAELALRLLDAGFELVTGARITTHPARCADPWVSVRLQAGNTDDALMFALHGRRWRDRTGTARGRRPWHLATTAAAAGVLTAAATGRTASARTAAAAWAALTADFAWRRIAPGPRHAREVATMAATSLVLPAAATWHWLRGLLGLPGRLRAAAPTPEAATVRPVEAVLFDRDGTLVVDVPYNGDPARVRLQPGACAAVARLRRAGLRVALVSNQSGVGRGILTRAQVEAVNRRVEQLLGPFDGWFICPHAPEDACECRKPKAGLLLKAAAELGVAADRCALVGDIGTDVEAALAAGARPILVPTRHTRRAEVAAAPELAADLAAAADRLLDARPDGSSSA